MAATLMPGKVLDYAGTLMNAVPGVQCWTGKRRFSEAEDVEEQVRLLTPESQCKMWLWVSERRGSLPWNPQGVTIAGKVLVRLPRNTSSACDAMYDLLETIVGELENATKWSVVPALPKGGKWSQPDEGLEDDVAEFDISADFDVGPTCE